MNDMIKAEVNTVLACGALVGTDVETGERILFRKDEATTRNLHYETLEPEVLPTVYVKSTEII